MNDISPIGRSQPLLAQMAARQAAKAQSAAGVQRQGDSVELSQSAHKASELLSKLRDVPDVRQDLVDRVRAEIASGAYETDAKLSSAIDALADDLAG